MTLRLPLITALTVAVETKPKDSKLTWDSLRWDQVLQSDDCSASTSKPSIQGA